MKKAINGKRYDTESAQVLAEWDNRLGRRDFGWCEETLYIKRTGEYFLHGRGGARSVYNEKVGQNEWTSGERIVPLTLADAKKWGETHLDGDEYEEIFGEIEDEEATEQQQQFSILLPVVILNDLKKRKSVNGINISTQIVKLLKDAGYGVD